jgi:hypothetical protein
VSWDALRDSAGLFSNALEEPAMIPHKVLPASPPDLADDLLLGARQIAKFIFGPEGNRRQVYYLVEYARLPVFRLGTGLCARRSVLLNWIAMQESRVLYATDAEVEQLSEPDANEPSSPRSHSSVSNPPA